MLSTCFYTCMNTCVYTCVKKWVWEVIAPPPQEAGMEEIRAPDIWRPPRAWGPPQGQSHHPLRKDLRSVLDRGHPAATVQKPQGAAATSPEAPLAAGYATRSEQYSPKHNHQCTSSWGHQPMGGCVVGGAWDVLREVESETWPNT